MHRPDEDSTVRRLEIELRNGPALPGKLIDKVKGEWVELNPLNERLVRKEVGAKLDAERLRKRDVILSILHEEAVGGRLYTTIQFGEAFENRAGLGSKYTIRDRIGVLATKGFVKFLRDGRPFGMAVAARASAISWSTACPWRRRASIPIPARCWATARRCSRATSNAPAPAPACRSRTPLSGSIRRVSRTTSSSPKSSSSSGRSCQLAHLVLSQQNQRLAEDEDKQSRPPSSSSEMAKSRFLSCLRGWEE
ncbi:hypothetical protein V6L77_26085 [Pannonibacter sp. Pt2-lr]